MKTKCQVSVHKEKHKQITVYVCGQSEQNQHGCENITHKHTRTAQNRATHKHEQESGCERVRRKVGNKNLHMRLFSCDRCDISMPLQRVFPGPAILWAVIIYYFD